MSDIVSRIRTGDPDAEAELVRRFDRGLTAVLRRAGAQRPILEDLLQETFRLALVKVRAGELRNPACLPGFVAALARNLAVTHFRRTRGAARVVALEEAGDVACATPGALETLLEREQAETVRRVLLDLGSPRDRELLLRLYVRGEDRAEVCAALGLGRPQLNCALVRARRRYRALYERALERRRRSERAHDPLQRSDQGLHFSGGSKRS